MTGCTCGHHAATAALQRRLDAAEAAMRETQARLAHNWNGGELDPLKDYWKQYPPQHDGEKEETNG